MFQTQSGGGVVPQCQTSGASSGSQQKGVGVPALEKGRHSAEIRRQNGQRRAAPGNFPHRRGKGGQNLLQLCHGIPGAGHQRPPQQNPDGKASLLRNLFQIALRQHLGTGGVEHDPAYAGAACGLPKPGCQMLRCLAGGPALPRAGKASAHRPENRQPPGEDPPFAKCVPEGS